MGNAILNNQLTLIYIEQEGLKWSLIFILNSIINVILNGRILLISKYLFSKGNFYLAYVGNSTL